MKEYKHTDVKSGRSRLVFLLPTACRPLGTHLHLSKFDLLLIAMRGTRGKSEKSD